MLFVLIIALAACHPFTPSDTTNGTETDPPAPSSEVGAVTTAVPTGSPDVVTSAPTATETTSAPIEAVTTSTTTHEDTTETETDTAETTEDEYTPRY